MLWRRRSQRARGVSTTAAAFSADLQQLFHISEIDVAAYGPLVANE
jgi:hypothetical protein